MKILELKFKNLNSLVGDWSIDFRDPAFSESGIFAIAGPTGAGKSTILDAICLALYGRTPRLEKISQETNEIMSRHTGECSAEALVECQSGTYRCCWQQSRARKKPDGKLQDSTHEISDATTGNILESKKRKVAEEIEKRTGLDFSRFTRSVLLAQGDFSAFLDASPNDRSPILEQITGTEIYGNLSKATFARWREEDNRLNALLAEIQSIPHLSPEEQAAIELSLDETTAASQSLKQQIDQSQTLLSWHQTLSDLQKEIAQIGQEETAIAQEITAFSSSETRLALAEKALAIDPAFSSLVTSRKTQKENLRSLQLHQSHLPQKETAKNNAAQTLATTSANLKKIKEEKSSLDLLLPAVRSLDLRISEKRSTLAELTQKLQSLTQKSDSDRKEISGFRTRHASLSEQIAQADSYLQTHASDATLDPLIATLKEKITAIHETETRVSSESDLLAKEQKKSASFTTSLAKHTRELETAAAVFAQTQTDLAQTQKELADHLDGRTLSDYRRDKDQLLREKALLQKIASLEEERKSLLDEKPCPLCGSLHHPYAAGNIPQPDETDAKITVLESRISQAEFLESLQQKKQLALAKALEKQASSTAAQTLAETNLANSTATCNTLKQNLQALAALVATQQTAILQLLPPSLTPANNPPSHTDFLPVIAELETLSEKWKTTADKKKSLESQRSSTETSLSKLEATQAANTETIQETAGKKGLVETELAGLQPERTHLFGNKNPDTEQSAVSLRLAQTEKDEAEHKTAFDTASTSLTETQSHIKQLETTIAHHSQLLQTAESSFLSSLASAGFLDEPSFLASRLSEPERTQLQKTKLALQEKKAGLLSRKSDRQNRLATEQNKALTELSIDELRTSHLSLEKQKSETDQAIGKSEEKLKAQKDALERIQTKIAASEAQKKETARWEELNRLIGSADGNKFRNFAQGLTFEKMVVFANQQLHQMTSRYSLVRAARHPLELDVIDHFQADEIRSTKNLSGGESFLASLALALGLSKMASHTTRVDSLFLDEGFGTLDEETLETALGALSALHQKGKLIGIISHVSALKERIPTQILVEPQGGGKSTLSGPGIT